MGKKEIGMRWSIKKKSVLLTIHNTKLGIPCFDTLVIRYRGCTSGIVIELLCRRLYIALCFTIGLPTPIVRPHLGCIARIRPCRVIGWRCCARWRRCRSSLMHCHVRQVCCWRRGVIGGGESERIGSCRRTKGIAFGKQVVEERFE